MKLIPWRQKPGEPSNALVRQVGGIFEQAKERSKRQARERKAAGEISSFMELVDIGQVPPQEQLRPVVEKLAQDAVEQAQRKGGANPARIREDMALEWVSTRDAFNALSFRDELEATRYVGRYEDAAIYALTVHGSIVALTRPGEKNMFPDARTYNAAPEEMRTVFYQRIPQRVSDIPEQEIMRSPLARDVAIGQPVIAGIRTSDVIAILKDATSDPMAVSEVTKAIARGIQQSHITVEHRTMW